MVLSSGGLFGQSSPALKFEVASVKPVNPKREDRVGADLLRSMALQTIPRMGDRVHIRNATLTDMVAASFQVPKYRVIAPSWMDDQMFDVEAKVPLSATKDQLSSILLSLLEERFSLKWAQEDAAVRGYSLVLGKGPLLLNPAAPSQRTATTSRESADGPTRPKIPVGHLFPGAHYTHFNATRMPFLCERIGVLIGAPVIDDTGLEGRYDVVLANSAAPAVNSEPREWVFAALQDLGLSLKSTRVATSRIRVISADRLPTPN